MPIVVSSSLDKVMSSAKCELSAKFYILQAENAQSDEEKLICLNKALTYATTDDILLEIFKQRVDIYAQMRLYKQSSQNTQWIHNILQENQPSFYTRCSTKQSSVKKFKGNCHDNLDVLDCIGFRKTSLRINEELITKKPLMTGKLIAKEEPFCGILLDSALYRRCINCLKCNNLNLIPCLKCQLAMFCSTDCMFEAQFHHIFDCHVTEISKIPLNFGGIQIAMRSLFELLIHFKYSARQLMRFVKFYRKHPKTLFQIDPTKPANIEKHAVMISLNHLSTDNSELIKTISNVIETYPIVQRIFSTDSQKEFLIDFLTMQSLLDFIVHYDYKLESPTALSLNFMYNMMQHSCASNVHAVFDDGQLYYFTKYPIDKYTSLTYNRILSFETAPHHIRKLTAKKLYEFECTCEACVKEYPIIYSMVCHDEAALKCALTQQNEEITKMKKKDLKNALEGNCRYIDTNYSRHFPCQEIYILHLCNLLILSKLII